MIAGVCSLDMTPGLESFDRHWPIKGLILPKCDGSNDMTIPTREEINVYDSLDERVSCERFLGKNLDEAEALFRENAARFQENLYWMGPVAFRYYVIALVNYIQSPFAEGNSSAVSYFELVLEYRLEYSAVEMVPIAGQLAAICDYIIENYDRFHVPRSIYGDFRPRYVALRDAYTQLAGSAR